MSSFRKIEQIEHITRMITENPIDAWLFYDRGRAYHEARQLKLALQDFSQAIELDGREPEFWVSRGIINELLGHVGFARDDFNHAIRLDPGNARAYNARGWFFKSNHKYKSAIRDYSRAIKIDPSNPYHRCSRGLIFASLGELGKALNDLNKAIRLEPDEPLFYYERARVLLFSNPEVQPENALPDLEEAIRLNPKAKWYREERGYIYFYLHYWEEAIADFSCLDLDHQYQLCPNESLRISLFIYIAMQFQGNITSSTDVVKKYLDWYSVKSPEGPSQLPFCERRDWPVPLARYLVGEIDEQELLSTPSLNLPEPDLNPLEIPRIEERLKEYHFVVGQLFLSRQKWAQALPHLNKARDLPTHNPMQWIAARDFNKIEKSYE